MATVPEWDEAWELWGELVVSDSFQLCHICGLPIFGDLQMDHLIPKRAGGTSDWLHNFRPAHRSCNARRGHGRIGAQLPLIPVGGSFYDGRYAL